MNHKPKALSTRPDGYKVTNAGGKGSPILRVHRLVQETFQGPCPDGLETRHLDGNEINNQNCNLKYGTRSEQIADQKLHGTFSAPPVSFGEDNPAFRHSKEVKQSVMQLFTEGKTHRQIAELTGMSKTHVTRTIRKEVGGQCAR